jgi:hypothetical protein
MGVKMTEFDGDFICLEVVKNGFCILAIQSFYVYNFSGNIFCKGGLFLNNLPKLKTYLLPTSISLRLTKQ